MNFLTPASVRSSRGPSLTVGASASCGSAVAVVAVIEVSGGDAPARSARAAPRNVVGGGRRPPRPAPSIRTIGIPDFPCLHVPSQPVALGLQGDQPSRAGAPRQVLLGACQGVFQRSQTARGAGAAGLIALKTERDR